MAGEGSQDAEVGWREWLQAAAQGPVEDILQFQVHLVSLPDRAPLRVLTAEVFLLAARLGLADDTFQDAYGVCDASFKINKADWALFHAGA